MCFNKNAKLIALFAAILVLFAGLISCEQAPLSSAPGADTAGQVGNFPAERNSLIGKAPARSLSRSLDVTTGSPALSYTFPAFLAGIWENDFGDSFHLDPQSSPIGYSVFGDWPEPYIGWEGTFQAVYYFDNAAPAEKGLFFASFDDTYSWATIGSGTISAVYYEKVPNSNAYFLLNLAKEGSIPGFPDYDYGQPMYATVNAALADLLDGNAYEDMLLVWIAYEK